MTFRKVLVRLARALLVLLAVVLWAIGEAMQEREGRRSGRGFEHERRGRGEDHDDSETES